MAALTPALLWVSAIGCGVIAGLYFAFSAVVMRALGMLDPQAGMAAMVSINRTILRTAFLPLFFGTSLASLCLLVLSALDMSRPDAPMTGAAALVYLLGMSGCTVAFNVPLNRALASAAAGPDAAAQWARYLRDWTMWNHVRTAASLLAAVLFTAALLR